MTMRARIIAMSALAALLLAGAVWYVVTPSNSNAGTTVGGMANGCQCTKRLDR